MAATRAKINTAPPTAIPPIAAPVRTRREGTRVGRLVDPGDVVSGKSFLDGMVVLEIEVLEGLSLVVGMKSSSLEVEALTKPVWYQSFKDSTL